MKKQDKKPKNTRKRKEKFEIKWWEDWLNADLLEKEDMVHKLPIIQSIWKLKDHPKKMRDEMFARHLNDFFQDLENAVYTKIRNEGKS
jgi:hypothetical protein